MSEKPCLKYTYRLFVASKFIAYCLKMNSRDAHCISYSLVVSVYLKRYRNQERRDAISNRVLISERLGVANKRTRLSNCKDDSGHGGTSIW